MEFRREIKRMELLSPASGFARGVSTIEYRRDPLTGCWCRINVGRAQRVRQSRGDGADAAQAVEGTKDGCHFCPENFDATTTKFPPEFADAARIHVGESVVFPNLYPFAEYHAVGTLTRQHYLRLDEFTPAMIQDNIAATLRYIAAVNRWDGRARYPVWLWNHLPPSGASIIHPHVQITVDRSPMSGLRDLLAASRRYHRKNGRVFWADLIEAERQEGQRFIADYDSLAVIASFAPRGNREVQFVFKGASSLLDLERRQIDDFADAVVRALRCYKSMGVDSFNIITYSGPVGGNIDRFRLSARLIARPGFQPYYTSDSGTLERFYGTFVIEVLPERVAQEMKGYYRF